LSRGAPAGFQPGDPCHHQPLQIFLPPAWRQREKLRLRTGAPVSCFTIRGPGLNRTRPGDRDPGRRRRQKSAVSKSRLPWGSFRLCCRCELANRCFPGHRDAGRHRSVVGLVASPQVSLRARHALRLCGPRTFAQSRFHHLPRAQRRTSANHREKQMTTLARLVQLR